jgi:hypothetical protein
VIMAYIFDDDENKGIWLCFEDDEFELRVLPGGTPVIAALMEDDEAEAFVKIVRNKLNARLP